MYLKMFGRDLKYNSFNGLGELADVFPLAGMLLDGAKNPFNGQDINYSKSSIFLDGNIVVPTASGLPLILSVNGTTTDGLKSSTKFDIGSFFTEGKANIQTAIYPTATVEVTGVMSVDAHVAKTGLKSVTKLHTSTFLDGSVTVDGGKLAKATINMPRDTVEVLDASVDFFTLETATGEYEVLQSSNAVEAFDGCTSNMFTSKLFGLEACAKAKYHYDPENAMALYFTGPSVAKFNLRKTDVFDKYIFSYEWKTSPMVQVSNISYHDVSL